MTMQTPIPNLTILTLNESNITDFSKARNRLLAASTTDWVLFVDSDEELSEGLVAEIVALNLTKNNPISAYYIPRKDYFFGKWLKGGEASTTRLIRLAKKDFGAWQRPVHEIWVGEGRVSQLKSSILHRPHASLSEFIYKIDRYSEIESGYRFRQKVHSTLLHLFMYPFAKFVQNYFWRRGYQDGTAGFIHAGLMSFHSYATWTKLYLLWHKK